jgi:UDP-3-O-[3-hydroxymyristoyl] glucosamine N-acyltransferase
VVGGYPAIEHREWLREAVQLRRLPELNAVVKNLIKRIEQLENAANHR